MPTVIFTDLARRAHAVFTHRKADHPSSAGIRGLQSSVVSRRPPHHHVRGERHRTNRRKEPTHPPSGTLPPELPDAQERRTQRFFNPPATGRVPPILIEGSEWPLAWAPGSGRVGQQQNEDRQAQWSQELFPLSGAKLPNTFEKRWSRHGVNLAGSHHPVSLPSRWDRA